MPAVATWCALLLVMASIAVFIEYVHHMAHSVRAITVIETVAAETRHHIDLMYPEMLGEGAPELACPDDPPDQLILPSTAAQAIDHLHDLLRRLVVRRFPPRTRADEAGALRVIAARLTFGEYLDLALDEIRHYGASSPQIGPRLRAALEDCAAIAPAERRPLLEAQLERLARAMGQAAASRR